jgi:phosphotransferase system HPr (HPr) family protein
VRDDNREAERRARMSDSDGPPSGLPEQAVNHGQLVLSRTLMICNKRGLHARAAAKFVTLAERFGAAVDVVKDGQVVSARSIMGLMMLGSGRSWLQ